MPYATIRGVAIKYEVLGDQGPWVALSPGGRRGMVAVRSLGQRVAAAGYRVLLHDRRNCGASEVVIDPSLSEYEIWADDLYELLRQHDARPAIIGGASSGCRLSLLFALRHSASVRAMLLWRVTGGRFASERLAEQYYGQYIRAAQTGGMAAVAETEHFKERIAERPQNRERILAMDPKVFIAAMEKWREHFIHGADLPVIGATEADLRSIKVPTCIVPGNDRTHDSNVGKTAHRLIPGSEYHQLMAEDLDVDILPMEEWDAKEPELARIFLDFLARVRGPARATA